MTTTVELKLNELLQSEELQDKWKEQILDGLTHSTLAKELFNKAEEDFLKQTSSAELLNICEQTSKNIARLKDGADFAIDYIEQATYTEICVVLGDRSFIINTIAAYLRANGSYSFLHLHPVIRTAKKILSVSYLRVPKPNKLSKENITNELGEKLSDLISVTNDFPAMMAANETLIKILANPKYSPTVPYAEQKEISEFLRWLESGSFVFLGYSKASCAQSYCDIENLNNLGLLRSKNPELVDLKQLVSKELNELFIREKSFAVSKLSIKSSVHRFSRMLAVFISEYSPDGSIRAVHCLLGLLTSKALSQEVSGTPLIRKKIASISQDLQLNENSHDHKHLISLLDCLPKDEVLILDNNTLKNLLKDLNSKSIRAGAKVTVRVDSSARGTTFLVIIPKEKFNSQVRQKIQSYLSDLLTCPEDLIEYHLNLGDKPEARLYFFLPVSNSLTAKDILIETEITKFCRTWSDEVLELIASLDQETQKSVKELNISFPNSYQNALSPELAIRDLKNLLKALKHGEFALDVEIASGLNEQTISIFKLSGEISLSSVVPLFENLGLEVISEQSFALPIANYPSSHLYRFKVKNTSPIEISYENYYNNTLPALIEIIGGEAINDPLNRLLLSPGLNLRQIHLIRTFCSYLWQINKFAARGTIINTIARDSQFANLLWKLFDERFNPQINKTIEQREKQTLENLGLIQDYLQTVSDVTKDRILRFLSIIASKTTRTNFYLQSEAIAIKLKTEQIEFAPNPKPAFEIYINSPDFEAVHLRSTAVSRGGIRWSDRQDDLRYEILGLMKTQRVKNSLIVPSGAKGGFVLKDPPSERAAFIEKGTSCYKKYIRCLLSITDNIINEKNVTPTNIVAFDAPDAYLVVAADKGTASFSDLANKIACEEFSFWLGDAFASGGSNGYDHKKFGITARGAWESAKRHLTNLQIDFNTQTFKVIGIGDMSGDVFGNGLLMSDKICLIAAFNHKHIFIDPTPNAETSFQERLRLFNLPGSQWSDYNSQLISAGGGVFLRSEKLISLSNEIIECLGLPADKNKISGEDLIASILRAPCDLLWNGGIGTYVKSCSETHAQINDSTNDNVRINGNELRTKAVAEGGNLGFSQLARIEYAKRGGLINIDAIDNSAGVNLSDHEVNIKILLQDVVKSTGLSQKDRDLLLKEIGHDVAKSVLNSNYEHALTLSVAELRSRQNIYYYASLIRELSRLRYIDRQIENLPTDDELLERERQGIGLTRPELAIIFAAVKLQVKDIIFNAGLVDESWLEHYLFNYFPSKLTRDFPLNIHNHQLRKNLIATEVTNSLIDSLGLTFLHRTCIRSAVSQTTVIKYSLAARELISDPEIRKALKQIDSVENAQSFLEIRREIISALQSITSWLISIFGDSLNIEEVLSRFRKDLESFEHELLKLMPEGTQEQFRNNFLRYQALGLPDNICSKLATLSFTLVVMQAAECAICASTPIGKALKVYHEVRRILQLDNLSKTAEEIIPKDRWENELIIKCRDELHGCVLKVSDQVLKAKLDLADIEPRIISTPSFQQLSLLLDELSGKNQTPASIAAISRQLLNFNLN